MVHPLYFFDFCHAWHVSLCSCIMRMKSFVKRSRDCARNPARSTKTEGFLTVSLTYGKRGREGGEGGKEDASITKVSP